MVNSVQLYLGKIVALKGCGTADVTDKRLVFHSSPPYDTVDLKLTAGLSAAGCLVGWVGVLPSSNFQETPLSDRMRHQAALHPEQDHKIPMCKTKFSNVRVV